MTIKDIWGLFMNCLICAVCGCVLRRETEAPRAHGLPALLFRSGPIPATPATMGLML